MMFVGCVFGFMVATTKMLGGTFTVQVVGLLCVVMGILSMVGRSPIKGQTGGFITGFGLGTTLVGYS
jgi:hypothetical protein